MTAQIIAPADRVDNIINNAPGIFQVDVDPSSSANHNRAIEWRWFGSRVVDVYNEYITAEANRQGVDPEWVRAIVYLENSHGYYD
ncbi:MAG TPA: hypothetical protein VFW84_04035, partial [Aquabacterium sp.]|uniref:hypothetical protein n=1 Tax=Aquabacterium sp. TaxID=1872578 RepID=UPI002E3718C7